MTYIKHILKTGKIALLGGILAFVFVGCSSKESNIVQEYNKPAIYWYNKMLKEIAFYDLEAADDTFISLESEHRNSPLIPTAIFIIANAHIAEEEYELAKYYLDEYIKRFGEDKNIEYIRYLKIKAHFYAFDSEYRDQQLVLDTLNDIETFIRKYPNSPYIHLAQNAYSRMSMAKAMFDKEISDLYERKDKPEASELYRQKAEKSWKYLDEIEEVNTPFYKDIFQKL